MGFAKYHEDDIKIYDDRMYYRNAQLSSNEYNRATESYATYCPFCKCGQKSKRSLIEHIVSSHGGVHEFIYVNDQIVKNGEIEVPQVYSLILYSFRLESIAIQIIDNMGEEYQITTNPDVYKYDLKSILKAKPYSILNINSIDRPVHIKQRLDINNVTIDKIISDKYMSILFDNQVSNGEFTPEENLIYMKMLIHEKEDTTLFIEHIEQLCLEETRAVEELYLYQFLATSSYDGINRTIDLDTLNVLMCILQGNYTEAETILKQSKRQSNDQIGCKLMLHLLMNEKVGIDYLQGKYEQYGFIGILERILYSLSFYVDDNSAIPMVEFDEISLFKEYPLVKALIELRDAVCSKGKLTYDSYKLLRDLTPLSGIYYCEGIGDEAAREKVLKSLIKIHKDSSLIKTYIYDKDYKWIQRKISVSDGKVYKDAVVNENRASGNIFSESFLTNFAYDDEVKITPLGGANGIGASCFVISNKRFNIMLDCGIDPKRYGDEAYPYLDQWNKDIDVIIVSHAHIDHSGGVPKAHAMWPDAKIITTPMTKVFLKYLFSNISRIKNGIVDNEESEIENITIEKEATLQALNSIDTVECNQWVTLYKNVKMRLHEAGHIMGAAMIELSIGGKVVLYTGDFCNYNQSLTKKCNISYLPQNVDYLITESTYFNKPCVKWREQYEMIREEILRAVKGERAVLLPASSVGRSQELVSIIGNMKYNGEIPEEIPLYIAGMVIPAITQIIPFMDRKYEEMIAMFEEFNGYSYPEENAIVIASSGTMNKGSAAYRIALYWDDQNVKYNIIANGYLDEDYTVDSKQVDKYRYVKRVSLSSHADLEGIMNLIEYVSPQVISFVHRGAGPNEAFEKMLIECRKHFSNDILCRKLEANKTCSVFDIHEWFMEGEK